MGQNKSIDELNVLNGWIAKIHIWTFIKIHICLFGICLNKSYGYCTCTVLLYDTLYSSAEGNASHTHTIEFLGDATEDSAREVVHVSRSVIEPFPPESIRPANSNNSKTTTIIHYAEKQALACRQAIIYSSSTVWNEVESLSLELHEYDMYTGKRESVWRSVKEEEEPWKSRSVWNHNTVA